MSTATPLQRTATQGNDEPSGPTVRRTRAGSEELVVKKRALSEAQLQLLLYANGKRSFEAIAGMVPEVAEDRASLDQLRRAGLLELVDPELGEVIDLSEPEAPDAVNQAEQPGRHADETTLANATTAHGGQDTDLLAVKAALRSEIRELLGSDGGHALQRLEAIDDVNELKRFVEKLVELARLYRGQPASDGLAKRFAGWCQP